MAIVKLEAVKNKKLVVNIPKCEIAMIERKFVMNSKETQIIKDLSEKLHEAVKELEFWKDEDMRKAMRTLEESNEILRKENEALKKELQEYMVFIRCSELDDFNPAYFQKGEENEESILSNDLANASH
ncbi:hypothetical protein [Campylobacter helveticus]|uniref:hypothetical protein n=1 Tax=Campylobacter helveticus TaxID=28898 RepID=UPI0022EAD2C4|nr:hypothetical protein [Campylobacter helveticus]